MDASAYIADGLPDEATLKLKCSEDNTYFAPYDTKEDTLTFKCKEDGEYC